MAFTLSQPLYGQGGSYTAQQDRLLINADVGSAGVKKLTAASGGVMTGDLAVTTTGTGNGSVSVASGDVFVRHTTSGQGMYYAFNDAATTVGSFAANSSGNPRIDLVCVLVTDTGATPSVAFSIVQGTPAASPVAPTPPASSTAHYLTLAQVTIPNGFTVTTTVAAGNIVDVRTKALIPDLSVQGTVSSTGTLATNVPSPSDGQLLYSSSGKHLIAYNAATSAWEQVAPTAGFRNAIINGEVKIDQRNSAGTPIASLASTDTYFVDRWHMYAVIAGKMTGTQSTSAPSSETFTNSLRISTPASTFTPGTGDAYGVRQYIEGFNSAQFGFGTAAAKPMVLSFWVNSSLAGSYSVAFFNSANDRSYVATYTVNATNTWEKKIIPLTADSSGTWLTNNGIGLRLWFDLGSGSTFNTAAGAWTSGLKVNTSAQVNWVGTNAGTFLLTGVQLEQGSVPTPFERRPYGTELALCQRYFERLSADDISRVTGYSYFNGAVYNGYFIVRTSVPMRATVGVTASTGNTTGSIFNTATGVGSTNGGLSYNNLGNRGFMAITVNSVATANGNFLIQSGTVYDIGAEL